MNSTECLEAQKLIQFTEGELHEDETNEIMGHLANCKRCARNLQILKQLDKILSMQGKKSENNIHNSKRKKECINDDLLYKYLEGRVTETEAQAIEQHLNSCSICFHEMASLLRNSLSPATDSEKRGIAEVRTLTSEEQVSKILSYDEQLNRVTPQKSGKEGKFVFATIKKFFEKLIPFELNYKPALAALILIILMIGAYWGIQYYNTGYQIINAENTLQTKYKIYIGDTRLSGGYQSTGISMLMAPGDAKPSYLEQAKLQLEKAIRNGSTSIKARHLLAQIFIIEKEFGRADSILTKFGKESTVSGALLNDIGVFYFQKKDWKNAADNFQSALEVDENLLEARYNLALAKEKLNAPEEAVHILKKYIELENNEAWKNAAQHLINKLHKGEQEFK